MRGLTTTETTHSISTSPTIRPVEEQIKMGHRGLHAPAVHNYGPGFDDNRRRMFEEFLTVAREDTEQHLVNQAAGEYSTRPWFAQREGETVYVTVPLTINRGDLLAELLAVLTSLIPTAVLVPGTVGWVEPTWTATATRHLVGFAAAVQGRPTSFSTSSSPVDLTRTALWIEACAQAVSSPGSSDTARSTVVPQNVSGDKSAKRYLNSVFATLRASAPDERSQDAINTLIVLTKLWAKNQRSEALSLVRSQKIAWSEVLFKGAPYTNKKVKGKNVRVLTSPLKPSRSPWVAQGEGQNLSKLFADIWSAPDSIRNEWNALPAEEQHTLFKSYVSRVREAYNLMASVSASVNSRLGHRKKWIYKAVDEAGLKFNKKDTKDPYKWSLAFFKQDLTKLDESVKSVFSPAHYLETKEDADIILTEIRGFGSRENINWEVLRKERNATVVNLFKAWMDRFQPDISTSVHIPDVEALEDMNAFKLLESINDLV